MQWGKYQGDGDGGILEVSATHGDIVKWGQKCSAVMRTVSKVGIPSLTAQLKNAPLARLSKRGEPKILFKVR
jgi:hypothetical protein